MSEQQSNFSGWAVVELFGHSQEIGFVTTQYFGDKAMFRVDVPDRPAREITIDRPRYVGNTYATAGSVYSLEATEGKTRIVGPGAVYALNPCTEEAARAALDRAMPPDIKLLSLPATGPDRQLQSSVDDDDEIEDE